VEARPFGQKAWDFRLWSALPTAPILKVDHKPKGSSMNGIVVGVDLSPSARAALSWAAEQARRTGQTLRAVHAVDVSPVFDLPLGTSGVTPAMNVAEIDTGYREAIAAVFDSIRPEPGWQLKFISGHAGLGLVAESVGAALLVVGTREHVGIGRVVFGSVSHYCLSHAQCPVVAVPAERDQRIHQDHDQAGADTPAYT
jgi:nucleotide-binding universal stress UspA family protein